MTETSSPALKPYPSWQSHRSINNEDIPDIISPFQIKIDNCKRLWAIDTGVVGVLNGSKPTRLAPMRLLIFDLQTDYLIRRFDLPELNSDNFVFLNLVIDSAVCDNSYAYIANSKVPPSLTVYSYKTNESWKVKHNFFNIDPLAGNFVDSGIEYPMTVGIYGLSLSEKKADGFNYLYFHALSSYSEFHVSTEILQNKNSSASPAQFYKSFNLLGKREMNQQSGLSVYDTKRKIIFYTLPNLSGLSCWKTNENIYKITNIYADANKMYPMDVKIDEKDRLWFLSNNLHKFFNGKLNGSETNFIVYFIPIEEAIKDSACKQGFIQTVVDKFTDVTRGGSNDSNAKVPAVLLVSFGSLLMWAFSKF